MWIRFLIFLAMHFPVHTNGFCVNHHPLHIKASLMKAEGFNSLCVDRNFCGTEWLQDQAGQKLHLHLWLDTHLKDSLIVWQDNNRFTSGD